MWATQVCAECVRAVLCDARATLLLLPGVRKQSLRRLRDGEVLAYAAARRRRRGAQRRQLLAAGSVRGAPRRSRLPLAALSGGENAGADDARRWRVRGDADTKASTSMFAERRRRRRSVCRVPDATLPVLARDARPHSDGGPRTELERARHV